MKTTSTKQFEILVSEMEKSPAYAKGFRKGIKPLNLEIFWKEISEKLIPLGNPPRDGDGSHKVSENKVKVKKKLVNTGGGANKQLPLSPLEEAVANLLEFEKQVNPSGHVLGFTEELELEQEIPNATLENIATTFSDINNDLPTVSTRVRSLTNSKSNEKERIKLLRTQTVVQQQRCSYTKSIKGYLKHISNYQRRRLQIEEERLEIYKRKTIKEEELIDLDAAIKKKKT